MAGTSRLRQTLFQYEIDANAVRGEQISDEEYQYKLQKLLENNEEQIKLLFLEVIGEDEPGKLLLDIGSEFATPRDYKRSARNHFREHLRQLVEAL